MFEGFPYTNFHELNLDWIIKIAKDFLDQYTNIQQTITQGLEDLNTKAQQLQAALDAWYEEHSEDIENQLADALQDLNDWYTQHQGYLDQYLTDSITAFGEAADAKAAQAIASIPEDYSALSQQVLTNTGDIATIGNAISEKNYPQMLNIIPGKEILAADLSIVNHASYHITDIFPLYPLQVAECFYKAGSTAIACVVECDQYGTPTEVLATGNAANTEYKTYYMNTTGNIKYIRLCSETTYTMTANIYNNVFVNDYNVEDRMILPQFYRMDGTVTWYKNFKLDMSTTQYVMTTPIKLKLGETIFLRGAVSASIPALIRTNKYGATYEAIEAGTGQVSGYRYTAQESEEYIICQYYLTTPAFINVSSDNKNSVDTNDNRKGTVCFIFDDGLNQDFDIAPIFKQYNLRCGFALISSIINDYDKVNGYLALQKDGFDILSHSTDATPMSDPTIDPSTIRTKINSSKRTLQELGFDITGWVTPSSTLAEVFKPMVINPYDYSFTNYYGVYVPGTSETPYNTLDTARNELFRVDMYSTTDNLKAAIDETIQNAGFLVIYFHWNNVGQVYIDRLIELLEYINSKVGSYGLKCLAPNDAYKYFYTPRIDD